jgi:uncharacterized Ntn-hydrolase superfamily protein
MTWSIVARDAGGAFGVAISSKFFAVGMLCAHARSGIGAVATQALVNPHFGPMGLDLLASGLDPLTVIEVLKKDDEGREHRQVHMINSQGQVAAHTGGACIGWCGHLARDGYSVAGNMLTGPEVLEKTAKAYESANGTFAERLIEALAAGEAAGGDKRGKQAAALRIHSTEDYPQIEIRVDDHPDPITELRRLYEVSRERFQPFSTCLPSRARPAGITDRALIEETVQKFSK